MRSSNTGGLAAVLSLATISVSMLLHQHHEEIGIGRCVVSAIQSLFVEFTDVHLSLHKLTKGK